MVWDNGSPSEIPDTIQLVASRVAQEYNQRKQRKGAFCEDRYHATAIETGAHLWKCLGYVDLNMVRAGAVRHPREWAFGGYHEIVGSKNRNTILNRRALLKLLEINDPDELICQHHGMIEEALARHNLGREERWSKRLAVGRSDFIAGFKSELKARGKRRRVVAEEDGFVVREGLSSYEAYFDPKNRAIEQETGNY